MEQYWTFLILGKVLLLDCFALEPRLWQHVILANVCHLEEFDFAHKPSKQNKESIATVEDQTFDGKRPIHLIGDFRTVTDSASA